MTHHQSQSPIRALHFKPNETNIKHGIDYEKHTDKNSDIIQVSGSLAGVTGTRHEHCTGLLEMNKKYIYLTWLGSSEITKLSGSEGGVLPPTKADIATGSWEAMVNVRKELLESDHDVLHVILASNHAKNSCYQQIMHTRMDLSI